MKAQAVFPSSIFLVAVFCSVLDIKVTQGVHSTAFAQSAGNSASGGSSTARPVVAAKPIPLNWRNVIWKHTTFKSESNEKGALIYEVQDTQEKRFRLDFVFQNSTYNIPQKNRVAFGAMADNLLLGGGKNFSYEKIQSITQSLGLQISSDVTARGQLQLSFFGLTEDIEMAYKIAEDLLLFPQFRESGLAFWKQDKQQEFTNLLDASSSQKQAKFIDVEISKAAFGDEHFYSKSIERLSTNQTNSVSLETMKSLASQTLVQAGVLTMLSGNYSAKNKTQLKVLLSKLKAGEPSTFEWLPERLKVSSFDNSLESKNSKVGSLESGKTGVVFIQKQDMAQSNVSYRCYMPAGGKLNRIEGTQMGVLSDVYSSQGGVVGNDRFSKAMRADSGISYSAGARFDRKFLFPSTNLPVFSMGFQTSGERTLEALEIASKTWTNFYKNGATQEEFENAKIAMMNRNMASEYTIFDKADDLLSDLLDGEAPSTQPILNSLMRLEKQKDVQQANQTLRNLASPTMQCFMVLFGNTPEKAIDAIKNNKLANFVHLKTVSHESIVKQYTSQK